MRSIYTVFIILLVLMTSAQCQQTAADWFNKGDALTSQGKYDEAIQAYDQAIQLKPNYDTAWYNKGVALKALGRTNESDAAFAKSKELANNFLASGVSVPSPSVGRIITESAAQNSSQYTQYYTMSYTMSSVSAPSTHISIPVQINILGKTLTTKYLGTQLQAVPYSQYQSNANNTGGNSLWIQDIPSWTQYIDVPQGATVTLIAVSPADGSGYLSEMHNGTSYSSNFYFYRNSQLTFYAYAIGQHVLSFTINGQPSNQVTINVTAYVPPRCYPTQYNYYAPYNYLTPNYYPQSYYYHPKLHYPGYTSSGRHWSRFYGGYNWYDLDYPWLNAP